MSPQSLFNGRKCFVLTNTRGHRSLRHRRTFPTSEIPIILHTFRCILYAWAYCGPICGCRGVGTYLCIVTSPAEFQLIYNRRPWPTSTTVIITIFINGNVRMPRVRVEGYWIAKNPYFYWTRADRVRQTMKSTRRCLERARLWWSHQMIKLYRLLNPVRARRERIWGWIRHFFSD